MLMKGPPRNELHVRYMRGVSPNAPDTKGGGIPPLLTKGRHGGRGDNSRPSREALNTILKESVDVTDLQREPT